MIKHSGIGYRQREAAMPASPMSDASSVRTVLLDPARADLTATLIDHQTAIRS